MGLGLTRGVQVSASKHTAVSLMVTRPPRSRVVIQGCCFARRLLYLEPLVKKNQHTWIL
jgi:hypothetical protein